MPERRREDGGCRARTLSDQVLVDNRVEVAVVHNVVYVAMHWSLSCHLVWMGKKYHRPPGADGDPQLAGSLML